MAVTPIGALLWTASVTLTNAQIIASPNAGIQIVAAPGSGKILVPVLTIFRLTSTVAYSNTGGFCALYLEWNGGDQATTTTKGNPFLDSGVDSTVAASLYQAQDAEAGTFFPALLSVNLDGDINKALMVKTATDNGLNFGGGTGTNSLSVLTYYAVVSL